MDEKIWEAYTAFMFEVRVTLQTISAVLIILKLIGSLQLSWFWCLSPVLFVLFITLIMMILYYVLWLKHRKDNPEEAKFEENEIMH